MFTWVKATFTKKTYHFSITTLGDALPTPWGTQMWVQTKNNERVKSRGAFSGSQHFGGVEGCARALGWD